MSTYPCHHASTIEHERIVERIVEEFKPKLNVLKIDAHPCELTYEDGDMNGSYKKHVAPLDPKVVFHIVKVLGTLPGIRRLATLAHELGHYTSDCNGTRTALYEEAINKPPMEQRTLDECRAILHEESLAWGYGLKIAPRHGLNDASEFRVIALEGLEAYRNRVALPAEEFDCVVAGWEQL